MEIASSTQPFKLTITCDEEPLTPPESPEKKRRKEEERARVKTIMKGTLRPWREVTRLSTQEKREYCEVPKNHPAHRYPALIPYKYNQVVLKDGTPTNGSKIYSEGIPTKVEYIAMAAPTAAFGPKFLEMILEFSIEVVVKLVDLEDMPHFPKEGEVLKIQDQYILESCAITSEALGLKFVLENQLISLKRNEEVPHVFTQFFVYGGWGHGNTLGTQGWVQLVNEVNKQVRNTELNGPILVYCEGGLARTGTFITAREIVQQFQKGKKVDLNQHLLFLRKQRGGFVQTLEEYCDLQKIEEQLETQQSTQPLESTQPEISE